MFVGNWTTIVAVRGETDVKDITAAVEMEKADPMLTILGSTLIEESTPTVVAQTESLSENKIETEDSTNGQLVSPLLANLVDMAMSQLI